MRPTTRSQELRSPIRIIRDRKDASSRRTKLRTAKERLPIQRRFGRS